MNKQFVRTAISCGVIQVLSGALLCVGGAVVQQDAKCSVKANVAYDDNACGVEVDRSQIPEQLDESQAAFDARMAWWREARFGVMVTFGLYSIPAQGEWYMRWSKMPVARYKEYARQFNPIKFNAGEWVRLFKEAGARYIVLIAKHHDGFAIWPSKASAWNIADATPYGKDLVGPLAEACRKEGVRFGIYYSHAQDWVHPGGATGGGNAPPWDPAQKGDYDAYIDRIAVPQIRELAAYNPDVFWFDTPVNITKDRATRLFAPLASLTNLIVNERLGAIRADFRCKENMLPSYPPEGDWEACMTLGSKWAYAPAMDKLRSPRELIRNLVDAVSKNGNLVYGVGPAPDGTIPEGAAERLRSIGRWLDRNGEAIYGCKAGPFPCLSYGFATRKGNQLNLIVFDWPKDGLLRVPLLSGVKAARLVGSNRKLDIVKEDRRVVVKLPVQAPDPIASVVALELDGEPVAQPNPTSMVKVTASVNGENVADLLNFKVTGAKPWLTPKGTALASLEFSFGKPVLLSAVRLEEPDKWPRIPQDYTLTAEVGGAWKTIAKGATEGHGKLVTFAPVSTSVMKLSLTGKSGSNGLSKVLFISPE